MGGDTQAGSPTSEAGGAGEANLDGPSERHPEGKSQESLVHHDGSLLRTAMRQGERSGRDHPEDPVNLTGETGFSRGEALPLPQSKLLVGPGKKYRARGSLVG